MGLHLIPNNLNIDFVGLRKISYILSIVLILAGVVSLASNGGPRYGIDFAGGTIAQVRFQQPVTEDALKSALEETGHPGLVVQSFGNDRGLTYLIRVSSTDAKSSQIRDDILVALGKNLPDNPFELQRLESVGPKVGADLRSKAVEAMYFATLIIAIYISGRFEHRWVAAALMAASLAGGMYLLELVGVPKAYLVLAAMIMTIVLCWKLKLIFAMGAIVSILHDVLITVGIFSLMGKEFDLTIIAALLTVVGYSLNDTVIVYDRIRENLHDHRGEKFSVIINRSINQTLSRTVLTSGTTLIVITSLLLFGGGIIHDFALVMFLGVFIGTASSMFVASPILLVFGDTVVAQAEAEEKAKAQAEIKAKSRGISRV